jgi:hypothetical protein
VHGLLGDSSVGVDLLEDSVDVDRESFSSSSLVGGSGLGCSLVGLGSGGAFSGSDGFLGGHVDV